MPVIDAGLKSLLDDAKAKLGVDASPAALKAIDERLEAVAASLALEWITGEKRFESQGQQTEYWLACIYEALFPDEQPDATRIYGRFGLPLPRAQYVARLLLARRSAHWRKAAHQEVITALEAYEKEAQDALKRGAGATASYKISLSRGGFEDLFVLYDRMVAPLAAKDRPQAPKREPSSPTFANGLIMAPTLVGLLDLIRKEK